MTNTDMELKPCPFCGGEAKIKEQYIPDNHKFYAVGCFLDTSGGDFIGCGISRSHTTKEEAIQKWNTRADTRPVPSEVVEALKHTQKKIAKAAIVGFVGEDVLMDVFECNSYISQALSLLTAQEGKP